MRRAREITLALVVAAWAATGSAQPATPTPTPTPSADAGVVDQPAPSPATHALRAPPPEAVPDVDSTVTPGEGLMTGDVVTWSLRIRSRTGDEVTVVDLDEANGAEAGDALGRVDEPIHRIDQERTEDLTEAGRRVQTFSLRFLLLAPGEHALPRVAVRVLTADGQLGFVEPPAPTVSVGAVLGNEPNAEPKPPTAPVSVMEDDPRPLYVLGALGAMLVGALLALLVARWWKRRKMRPAPPPPPRAPWVVAIEKLDALRRDRAASMQEGRGVEWADGVSDAVREYLGARYGFEGLESTTDEVIERLREAQLGGITVVEIAALLQESDLVKFAKAPLDEPAAESLLEGSYRIVRQTTPSAAAPAVPAPPPEAGAP